MNVSTDLLMPLMVLGFLGAVSMRVLIYITIKKEQWFAKAFEKRTHDYLLKMKKRDMKLKYTSFYVTTKMLLEKTYYEIFMMRAILKRRNPDIITDKWDRVFLLQQGCARLVKDTLKHVQFFKLIFDIRTCFVRDFMSTISQFWFSFFFQRFDVHVLLSSR